MTAAVRASFLNEFRALLPLWSACTAVLLASMVIDLPDVRGIAILAYGLGSCALGAHAFGHEYGHRTLPLALSQPIDRRAILAIKLATVTILVTLLGITGYATFLRDELHRAPVSPMQAAMLVWTVSVVLAPALTLLCRGTLPGAIFSGSLPAMIAMAGFVIGWYRFDPNEAAIERFQIAFFWRAVPFLFVAAAVVGWRTFMRLEAIEGRGREFHLPQWLRRTDDLAIGRQRNPLWQLIAKELRLQQMVFAIAAIYIVIAGVVVARHLLNPAYSVEGLLPVTFMYVALLALVAGALASAEERQLRTLEPQLLLPMAASRQWLVKAGVTLGVSLTLAVVLPAAVTFLVPTRTVPPQLAVQLILTVVVLASASLYVSSLTTSGVRAIAMAAPFIGGGMLLVSWSGRLTRGALAEFTGSTVYLGSPTGELSERIATIVLCTAFVGLMLRFAHSNHRSVGRSSRTIATQVATAAAFVVFAGLATTVAAYFHG